MWFIKSVEGYTGYAGWRCTGGVNIYIYIYICIGSHEFNFPRILHKVVLRARHNTAPESESYFDWVALSQLPRDCHEVLNLLVTVGEVTATKVDMATGKTLGSDGLLVEFYSTFRDAMVPRLESIYCCIRTGMSPGLD